MNKIKEFTATDGTRVVGNGPGYLHFLKRREVVIGRLDRKTEILLSQFKTVDIQIGKATLAVSDLRRGGDEEPLEPGYSGKLARVAEKILTLEDNVEAAAALKKLSSVIRAARAVRRGIPAPSPVHAKFVAALRQFAEREKRAPTKGELRLELEEFDEFLVAEQITSLCEEHGFSWLGASIRVRGKKVSPPA